MRRVKEGITDEPLAGRRRLLLQPNVCGFSRLLFELIQGNLGTEILFPEEPAICRNF